MLAMPGSLPAPEAGHKYNIYVDPGVLGKKPKPVRVERKPGRNAPCDCGSGRKYKKCCGNTDDTDTQS